MARVGSAVSRGSQLGIGISFLRFSREYEKQADLLGAQMMARAGYDPTEMANVFRTIEERSGSGGVEFLSDHPNPGNRVEYITAEAQSLRVEHPARLGARVRAHAGALADAAAAARQSRRSRAEGKSGCGLWARLQAMDYGLTTKGPYT